MKKLIIGFMVLCLLAIPFPTGAIDEIGEGKNTYVITSFYTSDFVGLLTATADLEKGDELKLIIMSPGGPAQVLLAMVTYVEDLKARGVKVTTESYSMTASAGAVLWLTGNVRICHEHDLFMFHTAVMMGYDGRIIPRSLLDADALFVLDQLNYWMRQYLLDILHDTELVNKLLKSDGNQEGSTSNMNWFTGQQVFDMGIADEMK